MMKQQACLALSITAACGIAATVHADLTWDWSFTGSGPTGSGTLTTDPLAGTSYQITGITGSFAGNTITGLDSSFHSADNLLYVPGNNGFDNLLLDNKGLAFDDNTGDAVNIFDNVQHGSVYYASDIYENYFTDGTFTANLAAAPEPSQIVSMLTLAGVGGTGLLLKLRRRK